MTDDVTCRPRRFPRRDLPRPPIAVDLGAHPVPNEWTGNAEVG